MIEEIIREKVMLISASYNFLRVLVMAVLIKVSLKATLNAVKIKVGILHWSFNVFFNVSFLFNFTRKQGSKINTFRDMSFQKQFFAHKPT